MSGDNWHHQNKEWQITLDMAKAYGWPEPRPGTDHNTRLLACPAGVHRISIFSTGRGSENVARNFRKKIKRCEHSPHSLNLLTNISSHLDSAERWITAAERSAAFNATEQKLEAIIEDAENLMAEVEAEFDLLTAKLDDLNLELRELVPTDPRPTTQRMTDAAHADLRTANEELRQAPSDSDQLAQLRSRHKALEGRLRTVRKTLAP